MLLISVERAENPELPTLSNVPDEIQRIQRIAEMSSLSVSTEGTAEPATTMQVAASLKNVHLVHVACHGIQDPLKPLESAFYLGDGSLSVQQLMQLNLKRAMFAFLSACETAKGDQKQPDQLIRLAAAMLFVGFKSVVATMWYV
jgi:CHAT domain-containing protein